MSLKERANKLKLNIKVIYMALKHKKTPWLAKVMAGITIMYALSPIDFIPDFIPVLGYLDDLIILPAMIALTIKMIPDEIIEQCKINSENLWADGKPKHWVFATPIILIWLLIIYVLLV